MLRLVLGLAIASGCAATPRRSVKFEYIAGHFLVVPVRINDTIDAKFIFDTGIGVNIISKALCAKIGCQITGKASGKRMSGQEVGFPTTTVPVIAFAGQRAVSPLAGVFDFEDRNFGVDPSISGFLSLDFFRNVPFTIDYRTGAVILEDAATLRARRASGVVSPLRILEEGPAIDVFTPMRVGGKETASVEIDTGSPALTLDERYLAPLGISPDGPNVKQKRGSDETGYEFVRYFVSDPVSIGIASAPESDARPVRTMFQKIIHDGLIGDAFLKHFVVTFDLAKREVIFNKPQETGASGGR